HVRPELAHGFHELLSGIALPAASLMTHAGRSPDRPLFRKGQKPKATHSVFLYFILCMVVVTTMLQGWPDGGQMLFAFGTPVILVWWQEKRRSRNIATKALAGGSPKTRPREPASAVRSNGYEKRIQREREKLAKPMRPEYLRWSGPIRHLSGTTPRSFAPESQRRQL
ncbi:MAG: hypothetical protein OXE76_02765, partial [Alphaproteobacteria bacterium]|nr:hypothetical protein [Alphaproteobacteria bacterium]